MNPPPSDSRVGQTWKVSISTDIRDHYIVLLVVGWDPRAHAWQAIDLELGRVITAGEVYFKNDPWWQRIA